MVIGLSFHHLIHSSFLILIHPYLQAQTYIGDESYTSSYAITGVSNNTWIIINVLKA
nr:hypothetical protein [Mycoplasmopsis bovis]QQH18842.1 hypothetical protein HYE49_02360 [Mycoplasmopsis bovis]